MSYKVEELLALRDSVSESAVSIDRFADEDVIKEHVLRPSVSANVVGSTSFDKPPLRASVTPGITSAAATNLKKPSPSPSVKRGKAERLLKEHGSPPGMRVTAGGRVVPSDLPPLSNLRFGSNNFKPQGLRSVDPTAMTQTHPDVNINKLAPQVQLLGTQTVIRVGDQMYALPAYEPNYQMPSVVPQALEASKAPGGSARLPMQNGMPNVPLATQPSRTQSPFATPDLPSLEAQWASKKEELRYVEQTEVLQADQQGPAWRNGMIAKKKSLILEIDGLRKQINAAKDAEGSKSGVAPIQPVALPGTTAPVAPAAPTFVPQLQQAIPQGLYPNLGMPIGLPTTNAFQPLMMYPPFPAAGPPGLSAENAQFGRDGQFFVPPETIVNGSQGPATFTKSANGVQSPGSSATRRSHAVPIKKPQEDVKKPAALGSRLDPKSPTYEPVMNTIGKHAQESAQDHLPPTPSPAKPSQWCSNEGGSGRSSKHERRAISQKPSLSSIDTTDFFPTNTHEHSSTRIAPNKLSKQPSCENNVVPATPDKTWPNDPWNPPSAGRSAGGGVAISGDSSRRLTSWPEAFGKQSKSSSPNSATKPAEDSGPSVSVLRNSSLEQTSADLNWPPIPTKPVSHIPSTYQEGYQAGLQHTGLPNNVEVLYGFVDGMVAYLKEMKAKDRKDQESYRSLFTSQPEHDMAPARLSVRGYLSGAAAMHDSAVSLAENMRSAKVNGPTSAGYRQPVNNGKANDMDVPAAFAMFSEAAQEQYLVRAQLPQQFAAMNHDQQTRKSHSSTNQSKEDQVRIGGSQSAPVFPRQFSGNQAGNRAYGTPISMQRYFPTPKVFTQGISVTENSNTTRAMNNERFSGLDGAMDELAGLMFNGHLDNKPAAGSSEAEASCFKPSSGKGKQMHTSPTKASSFNAQGTSSPGIAPDSPKKAGDHSPAKAKLEQVTSKLRRPRKDEPRNMSPDDKKRRAEKWRGRFQKIKATERDEIEAYKSSRKDSGEGARR